MCMNSYINYILILIFTISTTVCLGQRDQPYQPSKINFLLKDVIESPQNQNKNLHLMVQGDVGQIKSVIKFYGGRYGYSFRDYAVIDIPIKQVEKFSKNWFVKRIEYSGGKGQVLNDKMLENNNVLPVHQGIKLPQGYKGKGIIIGIIDEVIELDHPDFRDEFDSTRVIALWDQNAPADTNTPQPYGYGQEWNKVQIQNGLASFSNSSDHGSHVAGIAAGNGRAANKYSGVAPEADIIFVDRHTSGFVDFKTSVAEAVDYIFRKADSLGKPCVINASIGTYFGSHDGTDMPAQLIDSLVLAKKGRAMVCAAGNSGNKDPYHLSYPVTTDTNFTWFKYNPSLNVGGGVGTAYLELWADTVDFDNVKFAVGADRADTIWEFRGRTPFQNIRLGLQADTLWSVSNNLLGVVQTYAEIQGSKYWMQVVIIQPDSSQYNFRFETTGSGKFDIWSTDDNIMGISRLISGIVDSIPDSSNFPDIVRYKYPDKEQSIVSSWACSPHIITVGNYVNRSNYIDYSGVKQTFPDSTGVLYRTSSKGPTRDGRVKPDVVAPGAIVLSAGRLSSIDIEKTATPHILAQEGFHRRNTGTSMSAPGVAGIAALFFEKCGDAGSVEFYNALTKSATTDSTMSTLPNNNWGFGKADAYATLFEGSPKPKLTVQDTSICRDIDVFSTNAYESYLWNTGDTISGINIDQEADYVLQVDSAGCSGLSDTLAININPDILPSPPIIPNADTSFCEGNTVTFSTTGGFASYLWTNGETDNLTDVTTTGFHKVEVYDHLGCRGTSEEVLAFVLSKPIKPTITVIGETLNSTVANNYQWYFNQSLITDSINQTFIPRETGYYMVETFHANGCSSFSDSLFKQVILTNLPENINDDYLSIYPNPAQNLLYVTTNSNETNLLIIRDVTGKLVQENTLSKPITKIEIGYLPRGIYFVETSTEEGIIRKKIILE